MEVIGRHGLRYIVRDQTLPGQPRLRYLTSAELEAAVQAWSVRCAGRYARCSALH